MQAVLVAFVIQALWTVVRAALGHAGVPSTDVHMYALWLAVGRATDLVIVAGALDAAGRLAGARKTGAYVAALAYALTFATSVLWESAFRTAFAGETAVHWLVTMNDVGWTALDIAAIVGLAVAAGQRAVWVAPIAIAAAYLRGDAFDVYTDTWPVFEVIRLVALVLLADAAGRHATPRPPDRERALRGFARAEQYAWACVALTIAWDVRRFADLSVYWAIGFAAISVAAGATVVVAAWSIARANIAGLPRWPWYVVAVAATSSAVVTARNWTLSFALHWPHMTEIKLSVTHWSYSVLPAAASLCAFGAVAVFARRRQARPLQVIALVGCALTVMAFAARLAAGDDTIAMSVCWLLLDVTAVRIYRDARRAVDGALPHARVV